MARPRLVIDLDAVAANWCALDALSAPAVETAAVVKADAYGLGAARVASVLADEGCRTFFVAHLDEAIALRPHVPAAAALYVLNGLPAGTEALELKRYDLMQDINVRGAFAVTRACVPHLRQGRNPHILTLSPPISLEPRWLGPHVGYTLAKYGMSLLALGWAEEFKEAGIASNALWPRTLVATAAVQNLLGGDAAMQRARKPEVYADAAYAVLTRPSRECTGNTFLCEDVLLESGVMGEPCGESVVPELAQDAPFLALLEKCYLSGATFFVRTDLLKSVDGYDPRFQRSEDYDLAIRFARRWSGVRVKGGPTFVVRNHSGLRGDATDRFPMSENLAKFYEYDALLFDELFSTLDPAEYLPPGLDPSRCQRQIDLQKLSLAVMHRVNVRMDEFLVRLALAPDAGPYSASERAVMDRLIERIPSLWTPSGIELVSGVRKHSSAP